MVKFSFIAIFIVALSSEASAYAYPCLTPNLTPPEKISISSERTLLVTHASSIYDSARAARVGVDHQIELAMNRDDTVVYLQHQLSGGLDNRYVNSTYYPAKCDPNFIVLSNGGEFSFLMSSRHVVSVGGFWEMCQATTLKSLMKVWALQPAGKFVLTQDMDAIYTFGGFVKDTDSYYRKFRRAVDEEQRKPPFEGGTWSLAQLMNLIGDHELEVQFLKRNLPPFEILGSDFQVDLFYQGSFVETLQRPSPSLRGVRYLRIDYVHTTEQ